MEYHAGYKDHANVRHEMHTFTAKFMAIAFVFIQEVQYSHVKVHGLAPEALVDLGKIELR